MDYSKLKPAQPAAPGAGSPSAAPLAYDRHVRDDFALLPFDQQRLAVRRLAASGAGDYAIAEATGLNVIYVRRLLSEAEVQRA